MSVINQMLKDLQAREPKPGDVIAPPNTSFAPVSPLKLIAVTLTIVLVCNIVGWYIWFLVNENNALKLQNRPAALIQTPVVQKPESSINQAVTPELNAPKVDVATAMQHSSRDTANVIKTDSVAEQRVTEPAVEQANVKPATAAAEKTVAKTIATKTQVPDNQAVMKINLEQNSSSQDETSSINRPLARQKNNTEPSKNNSQMSVSSRHFTSSELVQQKLAQAEVAINRNEIEKAEQLFSDILIIDATQVQARKKLAALWYGRQAGQEAVNLLAQGIALNPNNSELRMLQAQILLKEAKVALAYQALVPLAQLEQLDYQVLLANTAQQAAQYDAAMSAYKLLIKMQPDSGRWYLGLGIVYDQNSQFSLALAQYKLALTRGELSTNSTSFAQQRIQALGE